MSKQENSEKAETRCYVCKLLFPYQVLYGGQITKSMKENEEARTVCESCKEKYNYFRL